MLNELQIEQFLRENHLAPLKSLGQNFLLDESVLEKMVVTAELNDQDTVVEVGPGLGFLTEVLSQRAGRVLALEKDRGLVKHLQRKFTPGGVRIFEADVLALNLPQWLKENEVTTYKVVANIPYYITSAIIKLFLTTERQPQSMTLLVQKEVAERICAAPGKMSVLALSVQLFGEPRTVEVVPRSAFYPAPEVDSAILHIAATQRRFSAAEYEEIFRLIKIGFSARRKKLLNNLVNGLKLSREQIEALLAAQKLSSDVRAEDLSLADWVVLAQKERDF